MTKSATSQSDPLFSQSSIIKILKFVGGNTRYPQEAKSASDTGSVYIVVRMGQGGVINETTPFTDRKDIKEPVLPEIIIVAHKDNYPLGLQSSYYRKISTSEELNTFKTESVRAVSKLGDLDIPEWKDKNMEFALQMKFVLK
jgi:hypothetical protein